MIERIITKIIEELGATGMLILGLYYVMFKLLGTMTKALQKINEELGQIVKFLTEK